MTHGGYQQHKKICKPLRQTFNNFHSLWWLAQKTFPTQPVCFGSCPQTFCKFKSLSLKRQRSAKICTAVVWEACKARVSLAFVADQAFAIYEYPSFMRSSKISWKF